MMKIIRSVLGVLVLLWDRVWPVGGAVVRSAERQKAVDAETSVLALYQFQACPFCVKVRRQIRRLGLKIELRDVIGSKLHHDELMTGGGEYQVPCLRIPLAEGGFKWLYESDDINAWLAERYSS